MKKITLTELEERQQISSLDEYTDMDLSHEEDYNRFKEFFPKSVEAIVQMIGTSLRNISIKLQ